MVYEKHEQSSSTSYNVLSGLGQSSTCMSLNEKYGTGEVRFEADDYKNWFIQHYYRDYEKDGGTDREGYIMKLKQLLANGDTSLYNFDQKREELQMSFACAVCSSYGIVMAADSKGTYQDKKGNQEEQKFDPDLVKIFKNNNFILTRTGNNIIVDNGQRFRTDQVIGKLVKEYKTPYELLEKLNSMINGSNADAMDNAKLPYGLVFGTIEPRGYFCSLTAYEINRGGIMLREARGGYQSAYILDGYAKGVEDTFSFWPDKDYTIDEMKEFAANMVQHAIDAGDSLVEKGLKPYNTVGGKIQMEVFERNRDKDRERPLISF